LTIHVLRGRLDASSPPENQRNVAVHSNDLRALLDALEAARGEVADLEALFQATHNVHHSWVSGVRDLRAKLQAAESALAEARAEAGRLREALEKLARQSCAYGDGAHWCIDEGCAPCVARAALGATKAGG